MPLVHSTFLVDLRTEVSKQLSYWPVPEGYHWDIDDIIIFAFSARVNGKCAYGILDYTNEKYYNLIGQLEVSKSCSKPC